ncbi:MAG TPA: hypothetical protein PLX55_03140 [bacterium]|nr:hypothetical protein [bacterium]
MVDYHIIDAPLVKDKRLRYNGRVVSVITTIIKAKERKNAYY